MKNVIISKVIVKIFVTVLLLMRLSVWLKYNSWMKFLGWLLGHQTLTYPQENTINYYTPVNVILTQGCRIYTIQRWLPLRMLKHQSIPELISPGWPNSIQVRNSWVLTIFHFWFLHNNRECNLSWPSLPVYILCWMTLQYQSLKPSLWHDKKLQRKTDDNKCYNSQQSHTI